MKTSVLLTALAVAPFATASGQACIGLNALDKAPTNLTVGALFADGAKGITGRFGFGSSIGFGGVSANVVDYDNVDGSAKGVGLDGGLSYVLGDRKNLAFCPIASLGYSKLPDVGLLDENISISGTTGTAGAALGAVLTTTSDLSFIPFGAVEAAYTRTSVSGGGEEASASETYGLFTGGVSFVVSSKLLIRPSVSVPFGLDGATTSFGIGVSFAFGTR